MGAWDMASSDQVFPPQEWIFAALERLGLSYARRQTPKGEWYAGLGFAGPTQRPLALTLIASSGTLRLTAHEVAADPGPVELAAANRALPLARCFVAEAGLVDVAIDLYTGDEILSSGQLGVLVDHLDQSVAAIGGGFTDLALPEMGATSSALQDVDLVAAAAGRLTLVLRPGGWLEARALPSEGIVVADAAAFATLDRLQNWTRAGKYLLSVDGSLNIAVLTPVLGNSRTDKHAGPLGWTIDQAMVMVEVARRHLGSP